MEELQRVTFCVAPPRHPHDGQHALAQPLLLKLATTTPLLCSPLSLPLPAPSNVTQLHPTPPLGPSRLPNRPLPLSPRLRHDPARPALLPPLPPIRQLQLLPSPAALAPAAVTDDPDRAASHWCLPARRSLHLDAPSRDGIAVPAVSLCPRNARGRAAEANLPLPHGVPAGAGAGGAAHVC